MHVTFGNLSAILWGIPQSHRSVSQVWQVLCKKLHFRKTKTLTTLRFLKDCTLVGTSSKHRSSCVEPTVVEFWLNLDSVFDTMLSLRVWDDSESILSSMSVKLTESFCIIYLWCRTFWSQPDLSWTPKINNAKIAPNIIQLIQWILYENCIIILLIREKICWLTNEVGSNSKETLKAKILHW